MQPMMLREDRLNPRSTNQRSGCDLPAVHPGVRAEGSVRIAEARSARGRTHQGGGRGDHSPIPHASASCSRVNAAASSPGPGSAWTRALATPRPTSRRSRFSSAFSASSSTRGMLTSSDASALTRGSLSSAFQARVKIVRPESLAGATCSAASFGRKSYGAAAAAHSIPVTGRLRSPPCPTAAPASTTPRRSPELSTRR